MGQILKLGALPGNQQTRGRGVEAQELQLPDGARELADLRAQLQNPQWHRIISHA